jgi:hypothetical protein
MKFPKKTATREVVDKISKLKGPNKDAQGAMILLGSAFANQDTQIQRRSGHIVHKMLVSFKKAFPGVDAQLIGGTVADLDSLWDTGQKLDKELNKLFQMRFPQHRNHLREFLAFIEATQIEMAEFWIGNLRKRIPKLHKALDQQERTERGRARKKNAREKRRPALVVKGGIGLSGN